MPSKFDQIGQSNVETNFNAVKSYSETVWSKRTRPLCDSVFKDKCTPSPFVEEFPEDDGEAARAALPDHIYMDAMGFGMGNCCLQVAHELTEQCGASVVVSVSVTFLISDL